MWLIWLNVNWQGATILISTSQSLLIVRDVQEYHIHEVLICNAPHEALVKNESLQGTSGSLGIMKLIPLHEPTNSL